MAHVITLPDGSIHTCLTEQDFYDLVEERMGKEAVDYLRDLIADTVLASEQSAREEYEKLDEEYKELEEKYDTLQEDHRILNDQYWLLHEQYDELREGGW